MQDECYKPSKREELFRSLCFYGYRQPVLRYRTSLQMKLITVENGNFNMVAGLATESYPDVLDGALGAQLGVITPVEEATTWLRQIVVAHNIIMSVDLQVCLDPHELNKCILREHSTLPIIEDVRHELRDAKVFPKADLTSEYWRVKLDEEPNLLTTCQTCFGRCRHLRLQLGSRVHQSTSRRSLLRIYKDCR